MVVGQTSEPCLEGLSLSPTGFLKQSLLKIFMKKSAEWIKSPNFKSWGQVQLNPK